MKLLVNQFGYETTRPKRAVLRIEDGATDDGDDPESGGRAVGDVAVVDRESERVVHETTPTRVGAVANWRDWVFWTVEFSGVAGTGEFELRATVDGESVRSRPFRIGDRLLQEGLLSEVLWYFKAQRAGGAVDRADRAVPFVGDRTGTVDVHGGWHDAAAALSKSLSHLHYANYINPQQIPIVVWGLLDGLDRLAANETGLAADLGRRIREEARHGADFLVRACDEAGYFYVSVFDGWSGDPDRREISAFEGADGRKTADYEAGFRQGGGVAIAALARASRLDDGGEFGTDAYRETAIRAFDHLADNNRSYLDDGTENVIDDYCALLAATEVAAATGNQRFREAATDRAESLLGRQTGDGRYDGWFRADDSSERPFFHAAEAGLPAIALHRYLTGLEDVPVATDVRDGLDRYWCFQVEVTDEVANPFGYPRQYVRGTDEAEPRAAFFMPHENETGYWWQGENARVASLAAAAFRSRGMIGDTELEARLIDLGHDAVDWLLGRNPFDVSMVHGVGNDAPNYHPAWRNVPGGVANGVTAAVDDHEGIAFCPEPAASDLEERWRWVEQWLPGAAWLLLALSSTERI